MLILLLKINFDEENDADDVIMSENEDERDSESSTPDNI